MEVGTFSFGKYRGWPACDVPLEYLVWALETMCRRPPEVVAELQRRAARLGSRDAITAQTVLGGLACRRARQERRQARSKRVRGGRKNAVAAVFVGAEFHASRKAFGGDLSDCPF